MAIEDGVDGAAGGYSDIVGQLAQESFSKLASTPSRLLSADPDDHGFELGRELIGIAIGSSRAVG
jgi:hypothetical protein